MGVDESWEQKIDFLKNLDADKTKHTGGTLLEHLIGVHDILKEWNVSEHIQDAGLFHSVYGTASFKHKSTNDRDKVRELIGEQAEEVVFMFCSLPLPRQQNILAMEPSQLRTDLLMLNIANQDEMDDRRHKKFDV